MGLQGLIFYALKLLGIVPNTFYMGAALCLYIPQYHEKQLNLFNL